MASKHYLRYYKDNTPGRMLLGAIDLRKVDIPEANGCELSIVMSDSVMQLRAPDGDAAALWVYKLHLLQLDDSITTSSGRSSSKETKGEPVKGPALAQGRSLSRPSARVAVPERERGEERWRACLTVARARASSARRKAGRRSPSP